MTFLTPSVLWALSLASLPLIIHLLSLRNTKDVEFSTLRFIKELKTETIRRLKIRQWILIVLRTFVIAFLVLMMARPVQHGFLPAWMAGEIESRIVIILDNSASMAFETDYGTKFERAKKQVPRLLATFEPGTELDIYQTNPPSQIFKGRKKDISDLNLILDRVSQSQGSDRLWTLVDSVLQDIPDTEANRECFIISDFQNDPRQLKVSRFLSADSVTHEKNPWRFYCLAQSEEGDNLSIRDFNVVSQIKLPNQLLKLNVKIGNNRSGERKNIPIELYLDEQRLGQVVSSFPPRGSKEFLFQVYPEKSGLIKGMLVLPKDDFKLDNQLTFEISIPNQITCSILSPSKEESFLLLSALQAIDGGSGFLDIDLYIDPHPERLFLDNTDILLIHDPGELVGSVVEDIQSFLHGGGGLIWFSGKNATQSTKDSFLSLIQIPDVVKPVMLRRESYFSMGKIDKTDPLLSELGIRDISEELPQIFGYNKITHKAGSRQILNLENGDPFLVEYLHHGKPMFYFTSPLNLEWNDLAIRGLCVPLLHRMIIILATDESNTSPVLVDQPKIIRIEREKIQANWEVDMPSGKTVMVIPDYNQESLVFSQTTEVGSYDVSANGELYTSFSVHLPLAEEPKDIIDPQVILSSLGPESARWLESNSDLDSTIKEIRFGKSLWRVFLILALLAMILEMIIGRTGPESFKVPKHE